MWSPPRKIFATLFNECPAWSASDPSFFLLTFLLGIDPLPNPNFDSVILFSSVPRSAYLPSMSGCRSVKTRENCIKNVGSYCTNFTWPHPPLQEIWWAWRCKRNCSLEHLWICDATDSQKGWCTWPLAFRIFLLSKKSHLSHTNASGIVLLQPFLLNFELLEVWVAGVLFIKDSWFVKLKRTSMGAGGEHKLTRERASTLLFPFNKPPFTSDQNLNIQN